MNKSSSSNKSQGQALQSKTSPCPTLLSQRNLQHHQKTMVKLRSYINRSYLSNTSSYSMSKNRTRSISPRRNHWREEIRTMRSWKEDGKGSKLSRKLGDGSSPMSASDKSFCRNIVKAAKDWNSNMFIKDNLEENLSHCQDDENAQSKSVQINSENSVSLSSGKESSGNNVSTVDMDFSTTKRKPKKSSVLACKGSNSKLDKSSNVEGTHGKAAHIKATNPSQPARDELGRNFSLLELKMEVYTTRLRELEEEREQLILDREKEKINTNEKREQLILDREKDKINTHEKREREQLILGRDKEKINANQKREKVGDVAVNMPEKEGFEGSGKVNDQDVKDNLVKEKKQKIIEKEKLIDKRREKKVKERKSSSSSVSKHSNSSSDTLCIY